MEHAAPYPLDWGKGSIAYFTRRAPNRLIVFVHGFSGGATSTWRGMERMLTMNHGGVSNADVVFYGYNSTRSHAMLSAGLLRKFLDEAAAYRPAWARLIHPLIGRGKIAPYDEVVLVAHSLGAPVCRRALLDAIADGASWPSRATLILFAPAHLGARLIDLRRELAGGFKTLIANLFTAGRVRMPVLDDLTPGSTFLNDLLADTQQLLNDGWGAPLRADEVIFGEQENVVVLGRFGSDPALFTSWPGQGHSSICRCANTIPAILAHL